MTNRINYTASVVAASAMLATGCSTPSSASPAGTGATTTAPATPGPTAAPGAASPVPVSTATHTVTVAGVGAVDVTVSERGSGATFLLLHGGAGPISVAHFADLFSAANHARVLTPTHPGFGGTPRPDALHSIAELAAVYVALLDQLDLHDVTVVGNSIGGWIATEIALRHSPRVGRVVLVDATGIVVDGHPVADPFSMSLAELMTRSYYNPDAFRIDPSKLPEAARTAMAANRAALAVYGGNPSVGDPSLRGRLAQVNVPTLVLWGEADRIGDPEYGRAYAAAIPQARFQLLAKTGHVPQIESPEQVRLAIWDFAGAPVMAHAK
ncbi:MAG TPA: alpha/beta hydrolase [Kofleriaceae bacterium]|jgi:pimeloyl-ACP methyl ester carboxylesterase|nr:alpha/beta hydrolase [Kofleriaceae bacterium]